MPSDSADSVNRIVLEDAPGVLIADYGKLSQTYGWLESLWLAFWMIFKTLHALPEIFTDG